VLSLVVERQLERIGETIRRIHSQDPDIARRIPKYRRLINLRNIIAHQYYDIDWDQIRLALDSDLPELLLIVDSLIQEIPEELL
jgi:uncharacterized protein with HEPN domain